MRYNQYKLIALLLSLLFIFAQLPGLDQVRKSKLLGILAAAIFFRPDAFPIIQPTVSKLKDWNQYKHPKTYQSFKLHLSCAILCALKIYTDQNAGIQFKDVLLTWLMLNLQSS